MAHRTHCNCLSWLITSITKKKDMEQTSNAIQSNRNNRECVSDCAKLTCECISAVRNTSSGRLHSYNIGTLHWMEEMGHLCAECERACIGREETHETMQSYKLYEIAFRLNKKRLQFNSRVITVAASSLSSHHCA